MTFRRRLCAHAQPTLRNGQVEWEKWSGRLVKCRNKNIMEMALKMVADVRNACYLACSEGITRIPSSNLSEMSILYNFVC